ncbi:MAG TPA: aminoglycoside 6-adenylyltransferase [Anaerolineae bacterium]|nr:aminoglycoside 6-adenylyltransferase [Anaerolineae bacterium]
MNTHMIYQQLEQRLSAWARTQPAIQAAIVVGSRARSIHPADVWSDLDLVVFASDATAYQRDSAWLSAFGTVIAVVSHSFGQHDREWIALYADGTKLDVACLSIDPAASPTLQAMLDAFPYPNVLQRGVRALVDKTGSSTELRLPPIEKLPLPDQAEFVGLLNRMWLDAIKTAKFIRRQDLWRAKQVCDGDLKQYLLTLLEWHATMQSDQRDIWYDGRFLSEWADRAVMAELPATFATYDGDDLRRGLFATLDLSRRLAHDIAQRLGYPYPLQNDLVIDDQIHSML